MNPFTQPIIFMAEEIIGSVEAQVVVFE